MLVLNQSRYLAATAGCNLRGDCANAFLYPNLKIIINISCVLTTIIILISIILWISYLSRKKIMNESDQIKAKKRAVVFSLIGVLFIFISLTLLYFDIRYNYPIEA